MWMKCLPRDTIQPMEYTLRNSNESICEHRKLRLQVPGKVFRESGQSVSPAPDPAKSVVFTGVGTLPELVFSFLIKI